MAVLSTIYTLEEAADRLRMTPRRICKIARAHGLCSRAGRSYLFSEEDIEGIWNAAREATDKMLQISKGVRVDPQPSKAFQNLLEHAKKKKHRPYA